MSDHTSVTVASLPTCDICANATAAYDGLTWLGPWAYMCEGCFTKYGTGLGLGVGQRLVLAEVQA